MRSVLVAIVIVGVAVADGFVIPAIAIVTAPVFATAQLAPTRVIVTVPPALVAVAVQLVTPEPEIVTAGVAGTESPAAAPSVAVIVLPPISAPVELVTKVEVHVERALTCVGNAAFVTEFATSVAAVIE